jgi:hypothetical protein
MKKRIQLDALEIQSFVTSALSNEDTRMFNGGGGFYTMGVEPGSGPCVECDVTGDFYTGDCSGCIGGGGNGIPTTMFGGCVNQTTIPEVGLSSAC